ncbi:MAG: hypothetical protein AABM33_16915 [Pseudomonadota bacterium]
MTGKQSFGHWFNVHPLREHRAAAAVVVLLVLVLQCFELRAELLFRSVEQTNGQPLSSPIRKYSNPSDTAYVRVSASGAAAPAEEVRVFLSGEITRADVDSAGVMASLLKSGKQKIAGNTVWLASNGGDIDAGMELGRLLRGLGVFTLIGKNDQCLSACVFAFMGGERRSVAGRLGIHRPFFPFTQDMPDRQARFRHLQKTLKDYVEEMDFPASLYEAVMVVPPESMKILAPAELKSFYLEGISPSSEDIADAALARRLDLSMAEYLQRKAKAPACAFPVTGQGRCDGTAQEAAASGGAADDPGSMQKGDAASARRAVGRGTGDTQRPGTPRGTTRGAPGSS